MFLQSVTFPICLFASSTLNYPYLNTGNLIMKNHEEFMLALATEIVRLLLLASGLK